MIELLIDDPCRRALGEQVETLTAELFEAHVDGTADLATLDTIAERIAALRTVASAAGTGRLRVDPTTVAVIDTARAHVADRADRLLARADAPGWRESPGDLDRSTHLDQSARDLAALDDHEACWPGVAAPPATGAIGRQPTTPDVLQSIPAEQRDRWSR
jgi:hypothetical protein